VTLRLFYGLLTVASDSVAKPGGATFVEDARTAPRYRLFSLDGFPVLVEAVEDGAAISVQVWEVPERDWEEIVASEPPEMIAASVDLDDGRQVATLLGTRSWVESKGAVDVTGHGSWAQYVRAGG
jgi:Gamma-glutamyl cyclotransferase, AIG2-like